MTTQKIISWIVVIIVWMSVIFYLSHQPATDSNQLSRGVTKIIIQTIEKIAPDAELDIAKMNHYIRKNAHFFTYLILGVLVLHALRTYGIQGYRSIVLALLICILYAVSDEVHQLYVLGRGGQVRDVIIDTAGSGVGIAMYLFIRWIILGR